MCILSGFHKAIYRRIFATVLCADLPWCDILHLLQSLAQSQLNAKNPGAIYIQENPEEIVLVYVPFHFGGDHPIMVVRRKYERICALPDELKTIRNFLVRAGFPVEVV